MAQFPNAQATDSGGRRLCIGASDVAPLLFASAHTQQARDIVREELGLKDEAGRAFIGLGDYFRLTRAHAAAMLEESLGLAQRPLVTGTTAFVMAQAVLGETMHDAMRTVAAAYNKLHGGDYNSVDLTGEGCVFRIDDTRFPYTQAIDVTLMLECVQIYLHGALSAIAGIDLTPSLVSVSTRRRVRTEHDPTAFWPCAVSYGAPWYAITYAPQMARWPVARVRLSEAAVHNRVLSLIDQREYMLSARSLFTARVRDALREGALSQDQVAERLGCSPATLRRKLTDEGQTFRGLRQEHLNEAAKLGLLRSERVADVASALGFSDCRSFTRAFKDWNGQSPQSYRNVYKSVR